MFSHIVPNVTLTLAEVRRVYEQTDRTPRDPMQVCNPFAAVWAVCGFLAGAIYQQKDAHVRCFWAWKDEQRCLKREAERQLYLEELASLREQEEAWQALLEQRRRTTRETLREQMRQREWEALLLVLTTTDSVPVRDAVLSAPTNIETMMSRGPEEMLHHFGQVLMAEELNRLQHALNGNIYGRELNKMMREHHEKLHGRRYTPYEIPRRSPEKSIKQESVSSDLLIPKFPVCKGPAQRLVNYRFQQKLERVPEETIMEQQTWIQNWLWMVCANRQKIKRHSSRKYILTMSLEQQPGFCYLHLLRKEVRDLIDWPRYPTLHEVCSWDPELRNEEVKFEFTREGVRLYHFQPGGTTDWKELEEINKTMGHVLVGAERRTFADVARSMQGHRITRRRAREWFNGLTEEEYRRTVFDWALGGLPQWTYNIQGWVNHSRRLQNFPPTRGTGLQALAFSNALSRPTPIHQVPGYCYLILFKEEVRTAFDWPAYLSWSMIASWNELLRADDVNFDLTQCRRIWHMVEHETGSGSWTTVLRMSLSRQANDPVGATWTTNAARWLVQALVGYQDTFGPTAPQPMAVPPSAPEGSTPAQIAAADEARAAATLHNLTIDNNRLSAANAIGTTIGEIARVTHPPPRPTKPTIKMDMPDPYEGDPAEISNWIQSMEVYFQVVDMDDMGNMILMMLQRIRKGKGNRAGTYSAVKLKEWIDAEREFAQRVVAGVTIYPPLSPKPPYTSWPDFTTKLQEFFMTTETRDEAIRQIQALTQGTTPVEDYIIRFKSIAPLTGFNDYALVARFKVGLNPSLGFEVIKNGAPADDNLDAWYDRSTELARGYWDAKKTFGDRGRRNDRSAQPKGNNTKSVSIASTSKVTETPRDPNAMDIDRKRASFKCYNCGKPRHIAKDCRAPKKPRDKGKEVIRAVTTETSASEEKETTKKELWRRLWEGASEEEKQEMIKDMGFQNN
ncbi:hypothetical protein AX14_014355 [Amanita brunnescens Koide BX004]|nr:hypothetical protein AX14_014355 [Amanita brunnescens Koide BX004]